MPLVKTIAVWVVLVVVAVVNGIFRQFVLNRYLGERTAHQTSSVLGSLLILLVTSAFIPAFGVTTTGRLLAIGLLWLALTVAFEFLFGHYVAGDPWERLVADYDLSRGRLWVLVLAMTFLAPLLAARLRAL
ncbi:MAG TPA: hypothetical protein VFB66_17105 [Tepidisphaeraceae bacterium]|nr:hypothetical protein [Tepidisphaeraceae bacterium]